MNVDVEGASSRKRGVKNPVPSGGRNLGIRSTARKPTVHAAIGIASAMLAGQAAAQQALPTIDVQRARAPARPVARQAPAPAPQQQEAAPAQEASPGAAEGFRATSSGLSRVPTPLIDTPQTVNVVTEQLIRDQGIRTMEDALRTVPGITFSAGEGGQQGDSPIIRGFGARTDIFRDGIRDPGWYTRDVFSSDSIEVFKGPSAFIFGRGSTGGAINITSKQATGAKFFEGTVSGTTPKGYRADLDASGSYQNIDARIAAVYQDIDTAGRDNVWTKRWGVAPSINYKFNQESRLKLNYIYQGEEGIPDYGHPYLPQAVRSPVTGQLTSLGYYGDGRTTQPVPINRNNWFGVVGGPLADLMTTETHISTARYEYDLTKELKFANTTRYFTVDRMSRPTAPRSLGTAGNVAFPAAMTPAFYNYPVDAMTIGRQHFMSETDNSLFVNQSEITGKVHTGSWIHTVVLGMEYDLEKRRTQRAQGFGNNLCDPVLPACRTSLSLPVDTSYGGIFNQWGPLQDTKAETVAWYASDSIKLNEYWDIMGGIRNDQFTTDFIDQTQPIYQNRYLAREDSMLSYRYGAVFHPTKNSSIYYAYGVSYNPAAELGTLSSAGNNAANATLPPEKNIVKEVGFKADVIPNQLTLTGALFKIEKTNLRIPTDPNNTTGPLVLNGLAISQGVEFGLVGKITDKWQITTGYAYTETEIAQTSNLAELGKRLPNAPLNSFTLWTTYDLTSQFTIGGGATWQTEAFVNTTNLAEVPGFVKFDAMAAYKIDKNWTLQFNIYNITNELYYSQYYQGHAVPAPSRYATASLRVRW
jgi:catecholate siderophore receptor